MSTRRRRRSYLAHPFRLAFAGGLCACALACRGGPAAGNVPAPAVASASFDGLAPAIRTAALSYPVPAAEAVPEQPMSLTASDGTGLRLVALEAHAVIEGPLAFTELHLTFENPRDRAIEGRFAITLPPGAALSRLAMRLDSGWQEAEVVERQAARRAYEDFLHRRQDPALLEKEAGNEFRARIFPIAAHANKEIIVSYSHELASSEATYRLPLRGLPKMDRLEVTALVGKVAGAVGVTHELVHMKESDVAPEHDFEVPSRTAIAGLRHDNLVVARVRPQLGDARAPMGGAVILFDTSASRAAGFAAQVDRLGALVEALGAEQRDLTLLVACFDQGVEPVFSGRAADFDAAARERILAHRPLGASDLHGALTWAAAARGYRRVVLVTDAIATAGPTEGDELRTAARRLRADRLDVLLVGGIRDEALAAKLAHGNLARDGVVLDGELPAGELARRLSHTTVSGVTISIPGAAWVWPETLDGLQPGDEVLVYADLPAAAGDAAAPIAVQLSGPIEQTVTVALAPTARPLVERAWVNARIARLDHQLDTTAAGDEDLRAGIRAQIVDLSTRFRVLSDYTALLVLETEQDYARFGIDRRALADILTVGESGLELVHRNEPLVMIEPPPPPPPTPRPEPDGKQAERPSEAAPAPADGVPSPDKVEEAGDTAGDHDDDGGDAEKTVAAAPATVDLPESPRPPPAAEPSPSPAPEQESSAGGTGTRQALEEGRMGRRDVASHQGQYAMHNTDEAPPADRPPRGDPNDPLSGIDEDRGRPDEADEVTGAPAYTGTMLEVMDLLEAGRSEEAVVRALRWRAEQPADVMALVALGAALEALGNPALAARAYGSIIDLFPARADLRRFAGERLERLGALGQDLAADTYAQAVRQRPDHPSSHRLLAFALLREGKPAEAFTALEAGVEQKYPEDRFRGVDRILREDLGLLGAAWLAREPGRRAEIERRLAAHGATLATERSLRFVLTWETDANDVDFHIFDSRHGHAYYSQMQLPSGGALYADVTTGYGPECFTIPGVPSAFPYRLKAHYFSRGPMGYGMGKVEIIQHDGRGGLLFDQRPFVVMNDEAYVELGTVKGPLGAKPDPA